jgi:zinc/manganese transport system substrate-binding protein
MAAAAPEKVAVVAAEDFWGSLARQVGGEHVDVTSLISDPAVDPHDYEPKPSDAAALARAQVTVLNGIGYDGWMEQLLAANPSGSRKVVAVGDVVGVDEGGNPHQWYSPSSVHAVIDAITEALQQADPANAGYFDARRQALRADGLKRYDDLLTQIKNQYRNAAIGASESIVAPLATDLGLQLITPASFLDAVSEGNEPTARDKATVDRQITSRQISAFVFNSQNATPDVTALVEKAKEVGVPVVAVTETLSPRGATFQDWQADQLHALAGALARAGAVPTANPAYTDAPAKSPLVPLGAVTLFVAGLAGAAGARGRRAALQPA